MNCKTYILDKNGEPQPEPDLLKWAKWFEKGLFRRVACDEFHGIRVSTVFLGLDHSFKPGRSAPILWETMIFEGRCHGAQWRYTSREAALEGHARAVAAARAEFQ